MRRFKPVLVLAGIARAQFRSYVTLPQSSTVDVEILHNDTENNLANGYWFIAPYVGDVGTEYGPQIFNSQGQLIWNGNYTVASKAQDFHLCYFKSTALNSICYSDAPPIQQGGHYSGVNKFFNSQYEQVGEFGAAGNLIGPDTHELNTPSFENGNAFIQNVFQTVEVNLTLYEGPNSGYVLSGCFQDINANNGRVIFQWCSYPTIPLEKTFVQMTNGNPTNTIAGDGTKETPWDYIHMNAIDKTIEGDYVLSGRHVNAIFKIAGKTSLSGNAPGSIIWQLGGRNASIAAQGFTFSKQHAVRVLNMNSTVRTISIFDNAWDNTPNTNTSTSSSGKIIAVNNATNTATLLAQYNMPNGSLSGAQGMVQVLENGNVAVGWGSVGYFSEYAPDGTLLYHAQFAGGTLESYRVWKFPWRATPKTPPTVVAYAKSCGANMYAYVSWNGATDVASYRFFSGSSSTGPFTPGLIITKTDFEVVANMGSFAQYVYAQAVDALGEVIGTSQVVQVFVPGPSIAQGCSDTKCANGTDYAATSNSIAGSCAASQSSSDTSNLALSQGSAPAANLSGTSSSISGPTSQTPTTQLEPETLVASPDPSQSSLPCNDLNGRKHGRPHEVWEDYAGAVHVGRPQES